MLKMTSGVMLAVAIASVAKAGEPIRFYLEDEPIYTSSNPQAPGFLLEVVGAMAHRLGLQPEIHFLPWKRAQYTAMSTPNAVIFPLGRTAEREPHYRWLCKVFDVPVAFISANGEAINSYEQAREVRGVGVILGTPQEEQLKAEGVPYVTYTGQQLYQALARSEVKAIYTAVPETITGWASVGGGRPLQIGQTLQTFPLWIAASLQSDQVDPQAWEAALTQVRTAGLFDAAYQRYFGQ